MVSGIRALLLASALVFVGCGAQRQANRDVQTTGAAGQDTTDDLATGATSSGSPSNAVIVPQNPSGPPFGGVETGATTSAGAAPGPSETASTGSESGPAGTGGSGAAGDTSDYGAGSSGAANTNVGAPSQHDAAGAQQADPAFGADQSGGSVGVGSTDAETETTTGTDEDDQLR